MMLGGAAFYFALPLGAGCCDAHFGMGLFSRSLRFAGLVGVLIGLIGCSERTDSVADEGGAASRDDSWKRPESCVECHAAVVENWSLSHHALAQREPDLLRDLEAFTGGKTVDETGQSYLLLNEEGRFGIEAIYDEGGKPPKTSMVDGVIGETPIQQFLVKSDDGRYQTHAMTFDVHKKEWFNVFGDEERDPADWGHWTGQGMNWNANCAWCHTTEYEKNYDYLSDTYASTWTALGVSCIQCHDGMKEHVADARAAGYASVEKGEDAARVAMENCASCHARREELTPNAFHAGERFDDHYRLALPDIPWAYFEDGQAREENYVYGSLMMSRMGHKGVSCVDCHNPHGGETLLPATDNNLCLRCHSTGLNEATLIDDATHSRHAPGSEGAQCVSCHMPERNYMQRDPRRDHGFTSPDPWLAEKYGTPNACMNCHADQGLGWAKEQMRAWYPESPRRDRVRERAEALHAAYLGEAGYAPRILSLLQAEENVYWRAAYLRILATAPSEPGVLEAGTAAMLATEPIEREAGIMILESRQSSFGALQNALDDPSRLVRVRAAEALMSMYDPSRLAFKDWLALSEMNADRPAGALRLAELAISQNNAGLAEKMTNLALGFDENNPQLKYDGAIMLDRIGNVDAALKQLYKAKRLAPEMAMLYYAEGLLRAEKGDMVGSVALLKQAVGKDASQDRWWYNLAVGQMRLGARDDAGKSIERALELSPSNPQYLQLRTSLGVESR